MQSLDSDPTIAACTNSMLNATQAFAPGATANTAAITPALNTLCSPTAATQCPQTTLQEQAKNFYAACSTDMMSNNAVKLAYETLYILGPLRVAICSKDENGNYCATESHLPASTTAQQVQQALVLPAVAPSTTPTLNAAAFKQYNIPFLFLDPTLPEPQLCVPCTRAILTAYISFETPCPFGPGLAASLTLGGQLPLYNAVIATCGANFMTGVVQAAGGLSGAGLSSGASKSVIEGLGVGMSALAIVVSLAF